VPTQSGFSNEQKQGSQRSTVATLYLVFMRCVYACLENQNENLALHKQQPSASIGNIFNLKLIYEAVTFH